MKTSGYTSNCGGHLLGLPSCFLWHQKGELLVENIAELR